MSLRRLALCALVAGCAHAPKTPASSAGASITPAGPVTAITSEEDYYERGINLCHGYLTERFVDDVEFMVKVPQNLRHLGVLAEPASRGS